MRLDDKLLDDLMRLAALQLPPERRELLRSQLERVLDYASQLPPLPAVQAHDDDHQVQDLREDVARPGFTPEQVRSIVPAHEGDFIRVPPVLGERG